jgi:hypothetical protein
MKINSPLWLLRAVLLAHLMSLATSASGAIAAGGLAIIGYDDEEDSFTVVALDAIAAGEEVYFTNNGWNNALGQFNGAAPDQGAGNESLIKLTVTDTIAKGSVFSSSANGSGWTWTTSGLIPGQDEGGFGEFSSLALDYESDQIYIFQASGSNPLVNPDHFVYALLFGSVDYPTFADSEDSLTGAVPPGLSEGLFTAFAQTDFGMHGDADGLHSAWGINLNDSTISALQQNGAHREGWLEAFADSSNWTQGQPVVASLHVMPEPSRALLLGLGVGGLLLRRRRN